MSKSGENVAYERILTNARALSELRVCNVPVPAAFRVLARELRRAPLTNLRDATLFVQLLVPEVVIESEVFFGLFDGIPNVRKLTLLSASYGTPRARKKWSTDMQAFAIALGSKYLVIC